MNTKIKLVLLAKLVTFTFAHPSGQVQIPGEQFYGQSQYQPIPASFARRSEFQSFPASVPQPSEFQAIPASYKNDGCPCSRSYRSNECPCTQAAQQNRLGQLDSLIPAFSSFDYMPPRSVRSVAESADKQTTHSFPQVMVYVPDVKNVDSSNMANVQKPSRPTSQVSPLSATDIPNIKDLDSILKLLQPVIEEAAPLLGADYHFELDHKIHSTSQTSPAISTEIMDTMLKAIKDFDFSVPPMMNDDKAHPQDSKTGNKLNENPSSGYGFYYMQVQSFNSPNQPEDSKIKTEVKTTETTEQKAHQPSEENEVRDALEQLLLGQMAMMLQQQDTEMLNLKEFKDQESYLKDIRQQLYKIKKAGELRKNNLPSEGAATTSKPEELEVTPTRSTVPINTSTTSKSSRTHPNFFKDAISMERII